MPYWQGAGFAFDPEADRPWLLTLATLLGPSLTRLKDAVDQGAPFFAEGVVFSEEAQQQLAQAGVGPLLAALIVALEATPPTSLDDLKGVINGVVKAQGVKKGLVMKSMRAALLGEMHGPDLMESAWIFIQRGAIAARLTTAIAAIPQ